MMLWNHFVDLFYTVLVTLSGTFGGNMGMAICLLSLSFRLALLPLTLKMARRQLVMQRLAPELTVLQTRHKADPQKLMQKTAELYQRHGIKLWDAGMLGMLLQIPFALGLMSALQRVTAGRFLWIADLARPDALLVIGCALLTLLSPPDAQKPNLLPAVLTLVFLWRMSSGVALYSFANGLVGVVQTAIIRRAA